MEREDEHPGGQAQDEPRPVAGGAAGGRADPLPERVVDEAGDRFTAPTSDEGLSEEEVPAAPPPSGATNTDVGGGGQGSTEDPGRQNPIIPGEKELGGDDRA